MRLLIVLTSHSQLGNTGRMTGFWFEEFAAPYYIFRSSGAEPTLASPNGGLPPVDPRSERPKMQTDAAIRFQADGYAQAELANTRTLSSISVTDYAAVFYPGGHGLLWDLANDPHSITIIETLFYTGRPVALVCHGAGALRYTRAANGRPLDAGKSVTGFSNAEEVAMELTEVVPFLVEDILRNNGGNYSKHDKWQPYAVSDGDLITGQNPASSNTVANALVERLRTSRASGKRADRAPKGNSA
ncbi:type 1 glutamine amidotransferase domain-containing protein [Bradyrhizobium sp. 187]|jgi:putative intracellular protease/amidase|uniref:type 1 glutamine amidotransferase domain-containing protein n=1 Tax=Bradyrhizobium sp. 187 TaxID=2782655 RepID=UPI001FFFD694|nr:type 1 glutamine amidotransferase domain-containing protein [Bradyrhizobium sp. 187]UPJ71286.1 type 1 glutamine amidotransferase domain-containing protein [Bradyrhizobium sp. 187]